MPENDDENNGSTTYPPRISGEFNTGGMDGGETIALEVQGGPDETLEDVAETWDERLERLQEGLHDA